LLAGLQLFVKEGAGLGVTVVHLKAVEEELLVVSAGASLDGTGIKALLFLLDRGGGLLLVARRGTSAHGTDGRADGLVGNGRTGSKGHSLGNGRSDSGEHAAAARFLDGSRSGCGRGSRGSGRGCRATGRGSRTTGRSSRRTATSDASTSSSSLFVVLFCVVLFQRSVDRDEINGIGKEGFESIRKKQKGRFIKVRVLSSCRGKTTGEASARTRIHSNPFRFGRVWIWESLLSR
jgi:hypothetical protein